MSQNIAKSTIITKKLSKIAWLDPAASHNFSSLKTLFEARNEPFFFVAIHFEDGYLLKIISRYFVIK